MAEKTETDYILGTHDDEVRRLGLQHRIWRPRVLDCWQRAGITVGSRVIDVGAGPGYATIDLAEIVGPDGEVLALERSEHFIDTAKQACDLRGLRNIRFRQVDLMKDAIADTGFDAAWCRWITSFVSSPAMLIQKVASVLHPGGVAIFHEYIDYGTWRLAPRRPAVENFVEEVMKSWRASGGEPDVALQFPSLLREAGLHVVDLRPHVVTVTPDHYFWQWPASFVDVGLARMQELGRVTPELAEEVRREFSAAAADPTTWLITPTVLEMVARKE